RRRNGPEHNRPAQTEVLIHDLMALRLRSPRGLVASSRKKVHERRHNPNPIKKPAGMATFGPTAVVRPRSFAVSILLYRSPLLHLQGKCRFFISRGKCRAFASAAG